MPVPYPICTAAEIGQEVAGVPLSVVVVDDDPDVRLMLRIGLQATGEFQVVAEAEDGAEAVALLEEMRPDCAVLDLHMPGVGGLEALPMLRARSPRTRIVVYSAHVSLITAKTAMTLGAHAVVEKTAGLEHLKKQLSCA